MLPRDNCHKQALIKLLNSIETQVPLSEGSYLTIRYHLEAEEAIEKFTAWVKSRLNGDRLEATEAEIVRAAIKASMT